MMRDKFRRADGTLTQYALACGYMEHYENEHGRVSMEMDASVFHVKGFMDGERFWDTYEKLETARTAFSITRQILRLEKRLYKMKKEGA
jgi:hypothetical protein